MGVRLLHVSRVGLRHAARYLRASRLGTRPIPDGPKRLRALVEDLGGSFVKFGQMLALQPDMLAMEYCLELGELFDRVPPVPFEDIRRTLETELGSEVARFESIDPDPIATASIGQVHTGRVSGGKVAIKVLRPGVEAEFDGDIRMMLTLVRVVRALRVRRMYWIIEPTREFARWTRDELDYLRELGYMEQVGRQCAGRAGARVPRAFPELSTRRVLVAEFLEGVTMAEHLRAREGSLQARPAAGPPVRRFDVSRFARHVVRTFVTDALAHGVFHADPHPANLLILDDSAVGYVDFGITGALSPYSRYHLGAMTLAFVRGDVDAMHHAFMKLVAPTAHGDPGGFRAGLEVLADKWYGNPREKAPRSSITLVMMELLTLSRRTDLLPEREVVRFIRSAIVLDGLVRRFAPGFDFPRELESACLALASAGGGRQQRPPLWTGAVRAVRSVGRIRRAVSGLLAEFQGRRPALARNTRALQCGAVAFTTAISFAASPGPMALGVNLATSELFITAGAVSLLLVTLGRRS